jgi:chromosome segregation ATPase
MVIGSRQRRRRSAAPGELSPLDTALPPESQALADALRNVFAMLETSINEFATRCNRDKGAVSRYLSGKRVPPREFVEVLLSEARRARGEIGVTAAVVDNLRELHIRALEAHDPPAAKIQSLEDDLRLHAARKKDLEDELAKRQDEVNRLRRQARTIERGQEGEAQRVIKDLERRLEETTKERRAIEKSLAVERAKSVSSRDESLGFLGCTM